MKHFYYNEKENAFAVTKDFALNPIPEGYVEVTEDEFNTLINSEE